jgi:endoribonuclease Dicer
LHARLRNAHALFAPLTLQPLACCLAARAQTVAMLPTGAGKTLIAAWLIKHYADTLLAGRASPQATSPARRCCVVFLCPTKLLVRQQVAVLRAATPLAVGEFTGDAGVDAWDAATWAARLADAEVVVATPQVVVDALAKSFLQARGAARRAACGAQGGQRAQQHV